MPYGNIRLTLLGAGAMNSPVYAPAGLLIEYGRDRIMIDGGKTAEPKESSVPGLSAMRACAGDPDPGSGSQA
jgi:hypothetical protein